MSEEQERPMPVERWKTSVTGVKNDAWDEIHRRSIRDYGDPQQSLAFYLRLFVESPIAMIVTTPHLEVADANTAAQRLFQRSLTQMRGRQFELSVANTERDVFKEILLELRDATSPVSRPLLLKIRDDVTVEAIVTASMIRTQEGEPEFTIMVFLERGENISSDIL
jgi:PAS domain S-box-containing protein